MPSAWELDRRPSQPCVVCMGAPDREISLPSLPEVHVTFGSDALCDVCAELATASDVDGLTVRAVLGWQEEDEDAAPDVVRLVMAWAGHRLPPDLSREDKAPVLALAAEDQLVWDRLRPLMIEGPGDPVSVQGRIVAEVRGGEPAHTDVVLDGPRVRLSGSRGAPWLVTDGVTTWERFENEMVASPFDGHEWCGDGSELAARRSEQDIDLFDFGTPIGPITRLSYLDRDAWSLRFAAPAHKPCDMQVVVDAATGLVLEKRFGDYSLTRWTGVRVGEPVQDEVFVWSGPVVTGQELVDRDRREHRAAMAEADAWFAANVTSQPLLWDGEPVGVRVMGVEGDGGFTASLSDGLDGSIARRPRDEAWWNLGWARVSARWSDGQWDWALSLWGWSDPDPRADEQVAAVRRWLDPVGPQTTEKPAP